MERKRFEQEAEAQTPLPHFPRKTSLVAATSLPAQDRHVPDARSDASEGRQRDHSLRIGAAVAMKLPARMRDVLKRYGLAIVLASVVLFLRKVLPFPEGVGSYQLPIAAVVLAAWYGGRGPGLVASLICITGTWYWFVPPVNSWYVAPEHRLAFLLFVALCLFLSEFSAAGRIAGQALRASEERFRALVQFSFDVWYWETDANHRFTRQELSERASDAPPFPRAEMGKTRWEHPYVDPDEEGWRQHRATLDAHLPFRDFERAIPIADGRTVYHSISGIPMFDQAGRFIGYRGVGRDISERKRAEAEHREHVWFLESMNRINRAILGTNDRERMMSDVLAAALEIFGCDRAWVVYPCDPHALSWHAMIEHRRPQCPGVSAPGTAYPINAEIAAVFSAALAAPGAIMSGPGPTPEIPAQLAEQFQIKSQIAMAIDAKAEKQYLLALHQCSGPREWSAAEQRLFQEMGRRFGDALSLHESERKLEAAQTMAQIGWWERDLVNNRVALSREVRRIFGVESVDFSDWLERFMNLVHPDDRASVASAKAAAALIGGPRYDLEYRVMRPDGTVRTIHSQGDITRDESGRALRQFGVLQDITERKQAEDELSEMKERFRVLSESALTGIYVTHMDRFSYVNPAFARMFGYTVEEIVYRLGSLDLTCPEDREVVADNMRRRLEGEVEDLRYEFRGLRKDGSVFPVEVHGRRVKFGGVTGVLGTLIDNTERKRAEDELRASEARFRTFVDHARDAFFLLDEELRVVDVNRQACEGLGYRREELIGMRPGDFDVGLDDPSIERLAQRAGAGEIVTFETRHRRKDGTAFPVEIRSGTFRQGGKLFYLALARDITERKLAEESLRQTQAYLTESQRLSHTGSWALDVASNRYLYTSEEFDRLFGFDAEREPPTREAVLERMHPVDRDTWKRHLEKSLREKVDTASQYRIMLPDGRVRHIHTIRHPVVNSAGEVVKLVGTSIDISERRQAEEERERLRRLETELAHANRLNTLGELTSSIAHEVSQPLGAMVARAGACSRWLAAEPPAMAEAHSALANIISDGKRAREVIARIRTLAKRQPPRMDLLDVNRKILDVLSFVDQELDSHEVVLETRLDSTLPKVMGDRVQLQQVILNLVKNAVEAMSAVNDRRRELTIISARGPDGVIVEVRDCGIGLDAQGAERLFEAFYTTKPEGLGIGLSISRSIIEAHGGRLWAAPGEPQGAVFAFSLPIAKEEKS